MGVYTMSDVKWIKLNPEFLDGSSFKFMRRAKMEGVVDFRDKLESVWFELLGLAGQVNNQGSFHNDEIAYNTYEEIAIMLDRTEKEIELCMNFYLNHNMISIINDCFQLTNWVKYQNVKGLEEIREKGRRRVAKYREKNKVKQLCNVTCNATVTLPSLEEVDLDIELDKDKDKDKTKEKNKNVNSKKPKVKSGTNIPPTLEEIKEYANSKYLLVDTEKFYNYYGSNGWFVGKTKMKNWHFAIATWEKNIKSKNPSEYEKLVSDLKRPHLLVGGHDYREPNALIMCEYKKHQDETIKALLGSYSKAKCKAMIEFDLKINVDGNLKPVENEMKQGSIIVPKSSNVHVDFSKLAKKGI